MLLIQTATAEVHFSSGGSEFEDFVPVSEHEQSEHGYEEFIGWKIGKLDKDGGKENGGSLSNKLEQN